MVKKKIAVVSSANMDLVFPMEKVPAAGQTVMETARAPRHVPGGKGANAAVAFARLGGDCMFCACLGDDENGRELRALYRKEGIDTRYLVSDANAATGVALILVEESGANRITVYPGANLCLPAGAVTAALNEKPDALFLQFEIGYDRILQAAGEAARAGIPIFVDAGAVKANFPFDRLPPLALFSPNETEAETLTGILPADLPSETECARRVSERLRAQAIVLKLGARGSFFYSPAVDKGEEVPACPAFTAVDTTAAGDAYTAALTLSYLNGSSWLTAMRKASVVGGIVVTRPGASSSIPTDEEVRAWVDTHKTEKF